MDDNQSAYEELGPTRPSTCSDRPTPRSPPARVKRLIAQLGLRYQPSAQADLESHAGQLALLAVDLAAENPDLLERAIEQHVRQSKFMPKAAELIEIIRELDKRHGKPDLHAIAAKYNERLIGEGRRDIHWIVQGDDLKLESTAPTRPLSSRPITVSPAEIIAYAKQINKARRKVSQE